MSAKRVVILSTADFASAVWTNKQHLARELARHIPVTYIETLGTRRPTFAVTDIRRMLHRLRSNRSVNASNSIPPGVDVIRPKVIPFHGMAAFRMLNKYLVRHLHVETAGAVLWTFSPITYGLEDRFARTVYHSVDLLHTQHSSPDLCLAAEAALLQKADCVIASSLGVRKHLSGMGRQDVLLWENVADTALYETADERRQRRAVFAGNLTPSKVDFRLLRSLVAAGMQVTLAGPTSIDGTSARREMNDLLTLPGIDYVGSLPPAELARVMASSMVGLIPYRINEYTAGVFPMKVYEYLAAGLKVVSTALPSLQQTESEDLVLAEGESFVTAVQAGVDCWSEQAAARRRALARSHSWRARGEQALMLIEELFHAEGVT
jgi:teichuronic acid biosynthesis glycosyltransferase TuaH